MSLLNIHVRWNISPQYCSERAAEILNLFCLAVSCFCLWRFPRQLRVFCEYLFLIIQNCDNWRLGPSLSHRSWSQCRETHHHHSPRNLMSLTTKVSFSVNIYQWMKLYLLSLSMESGGPKSILVSMSQAEHSPHLSGNITANILANRSGAMLCWWWHMWRLQECIRGQERPAPTSLVMMPGHRGHVLARPLTDSLALTSGKMVHHTTQLSEPHSFWGLWGFQEMIALAGSWIRIKYVDG